MRNFLVHRAVIGFTALVASSLFTNVTAAASSSVILPPLAGLDRVAVDVVVVGEGFEAPARRAVASMIADRCRRVLEGEGLLVKEGAESTLYLLVKATANRGGSSVLLVRAWLKEPAILEREILGEPYEVAAVLWELEKLEVVQAAELEDRAAALGTILAREVALEIHQATREYGASRTGASEIAPIQQGLEIR